MARNNNKMTKIEPSETTLVFSVPATPAVGDEYYIDLSQAASIINRRFYRQGLQWAVAGFKIITGNAGTVMLSKLPSSWTMSNSWEKSFRTWQRMNNEALEESPSVRPKFLDFKVYADSDHHAKGFSSNLLPQTAQFGVGFFLVDATPGEWESSKILIPDTTLGATGGAQEREFIATGANYPGLGASGLNAVSLIEGYAASRGLPNRVDPNVPGDADDADGVSPQNWMAATFNEGLVTTEQVLQDMTSENNIAPYPFENDGVNVDTMYPGGANQLEGLAFHDLSLLTATTIGGTTRVKGGLFPCGLIRVDWYPSVADTTMTIVVDLVPGQHRGYLAEPMTEM